MIISDNSHPKVQRFLGMAHIEAVRRYSLKPFEDDDSLVFASVDPFGHPPVSSDFETQVRYFELRLKGQSHNMAEILATGAYPGFNGTNKAFNRGRTNNNQFERCPRLGDYYRGIAESQGVSTTGRYYCHGLGRYPGDPRAWVSDTSDVLRIARERNLNIDGIVSHRGHDVPPQPDVPLAEDIWERETQAYLQEHPDARYEDAREKMFNLRTGKERIGDLLVDDSTPSPDEVFARDED
jgi:hypothetical protein